MSCKYSCSWDLFSIWIFALSEVMCTFLPMPLDCGLLSVNMWLSLWPSIGVRDTAGDKHWKHNWKVMQLPMWTCGHWAIYNLSVFPSFGSVCLFSVFIKQSWYPPSSLHAKGDWIALGSTFWLPGMCCGFDKENSTQPLQKEGRTQVH